MMLPFPSHDKDATGHFSETDIEEGITASHNARAEELMCDCQNIERSSSVTREIKDSTPLDSRRFITSAQHYDCPICLGNYPYNSDERGVFCGSLDRDEISQEEIGESDDVRFDRHASTQRALSLFAPQEVSHLSFTLENCHHTMCRHCLISFIESKVIDGITDIPCCCPATIIGENVIECDEKRMKEAEPFNDSNSKQNCCGEIITDSDIDRLFMKGSNYEYRQDIYFSERNDCQIYELYKKRKFDKIHGYRCRRCPICDKAHIFDFQTQTETNESNTESPHLLHSLVTVEEDELRISDPDLKENRKVIVRMPSFGNPIKMKRKLGKSDAIICEAGIDARRKENNSKYFYSRAYRSDCRTTSKASVVCGGE